MAVDYFYLPHPVDAFGVCSSMQAANTKRNTRREMASLNERWR